MYTYRPISVTGHIDKMVDQLVRPQHVKSMFLFHRTSLQTFKVHYTQTSVIDDWLENINDNQTTGGWLSFRYF